MWEDLSLDKYVMREEKFDEKGAGFSSIANHKHEYLQTFTKCLFTKINMKKFFSIESKV